MTPEQSLFGKKISTYYFFNSSREVGCERIFLVNNKTREGIDELMEYLSEDLPPLTLEQAKFKQRLGINEWDPLPEGVEYPEEIR